jgi:hypothetical protein
MIKKITTLVNTNRKNLVRKGLVLGGITVGIIAGALLAKPEGEVVVEETVEETSTFTD